MELHCLYALFLISVFDTVETSGTCEVPSFSLPNGVSGSPNSANVQVIVPTMSFSGCGVVRNWTVVASGRDGSGNNVRGRSIELQLFRPDSTQSTVFTKVTNSVVTTSVGWQVATYTFTGIDFTFSPRDVLGFYYPNTGEYLRMHLTTTLSPHSIQVKTTSAPGSIVTVVPQALPWVPLMSVAVSCMACSTSISMVSSPKQLSSMLTSSISIASSTVEASANPTSIEDASTKSPLISASIMSSLSSVLEASSSNEPSATSSQSPSSNVSPPLTTGSEVPSDHITTSSSQPSSSTDVGLPVDNTAPPSSPGAAIGGAVGAVVVVVLVVILLSVVVAVCAVKKRRKYKLGKPPLYDLPPDAYCTFGSGHTLMPPNGQHEMTQLTLPTHYDDIVGHQTSDVTNNQSAVAYETPQTTLQRQSNEMYDDIRDPLSTSKGAPENRTVYSEMVYTNPGTDVQVDTSDHEYQDADEISLEEVKRQPPLEWDETKSEPVYGWVPTMSQRKNVSGSENTASGTENVYYSNPGCTRELPKPPTLQRKTSTVQLEYEAAPESETYWTPATKEEEIYAQMAQWGYQEIPRSKIILSKKLGEGQFGEVYKAEMRTVRGVSLDVAVKLVKEGAPDQERTKFLQEAANLGQFKHRHVVRLIGVVTCDEPQMMLMELLTGGDLKEHLDSLRNSPSELSSPDLPSLLLQFCKQVVDGLACLARKSFVHRDIAARNILLDKDLNCKISDFGMTRDLEDDNYYSLKQGSKIPLKWTAPETLFYKKYSIHSDIWSYGMLMYEIWSVGHKPFEDVDSSEMVRLLHNNYCLPPPPGCPRAVYEVMVKCWNYTPRDRPSAEDILGDFCRSERQLLSWRKTDGNSSSSKTLGAPLSEGRELYRDLQCTYTNT